jgi:hypothetical protein
VPVHRSDLEPGGPLDQQQQHHKITVYVKYEQLVEACVDSEGIFTGQRDRGGKMLLEKIFRIIGNTFKTFFFGGGGATFRICFG